MAKESGVGESSRAHFGGAGAVRSLGDSFQPNLAMGGGNYKIPLEMPAGPGGLAPQLDLRYDTGTGNGPFGIGWSLSLPFIERRRPRAFMAEGEPEYSLGGAQPLVRPTPATTCLGVGTVAALRIDRNTWRSRTLTSSSCISAAPPPRASRSPRRDPPHTALARRKQVFPGGRKIHSNICATAINSTCVPSPGAYTAWSSSTRSARSVVAVRRRLRDSHAPQLRRIELHQDRLPDTFMRARFLRIRRPLHAHLAIGARHPDGSARRNGAIDCHRTCSPTQTSARRRAASSGSTAR